MAPAALSHLFSPIRIRGLEIKNRILSTGHDTTLITGGVPNDALIAYHEARAKGGVGLIVVQAAGIHETAKYTSHVLMASDGERAGLSASGRDGAQARLQDLRAAVPSRARDHGKPGRQRAGGLCALRGAERALPRDAAADEQGDDRGRHQGLWRVPRGGCAAPGSTGSRSWPATAICRRSSSIRASTGATTSMAASFENRLRFLREVIASVRAHVDDATVVGLRISGDEKDPEGLEESESLQAIVTLGDTLDYVNVIAGSSAGFGGAVHIVPPMAIANAYVAPFAAAVKSRIKAAGVRRRPHQPAAGRREDHRLRPGRHGRHDPRDDLRSRDAGARRRPASSTTSAPASPATRPASAISTSAIRSPASSIRRPAAS